jgi:hypothetical protein
MRVGIVGAGMAGLACAEGLVRQGHEVLLLDKGRGPGGRMSTRRLQTDSGLAHFDQGAQYFSVRDDGFRERVNAWIAEGVVARWLPAGSDAYVGVPAMNEPIRQMAAGQSVHWSTLVTKVEKINPGWRLLAIVAAQNAPGDRVWGAMPDPRRARQPNSRGNPDCHRSARSPGLPSMATDRGRGRSAGSTGPPQCRAISLRVPQALAPPQPSDAAAVQCRHREPISGRHRSCSASQAHGRCPPRIDRSSSAPTTRPSDAP